MWGYLNKTIDESMHTYEAHNLKLASKCLQPPDKKNQHKDQQMNLGVIIASKFNTSIKETCDIIMQIISPSYSFLAAHAKTSFFLV